MSVSPFMAQIAYGTATCKLLCAVFVTLVQESASSFRHDCWFKRDEMFAPISRIHRVSFDLNRGVVNHAISFLSHH